MKSFTNKLNELNAKACEKILALIENKGTKSRFSNDLSLKISDKSYMFTLKGESYLVEIKKRFNNDIVLLDIYGYIYDKSVLTTEDWLKLCDYLISSHSKNKIK